MARRLGTGRDPQSGCARRLVWRVRSSERRGTRPACGPSQVHLPQLRLRLRLRLGLGPCPLNRIERLCVLLPRATVGITDAGGVLGKRGAIHPLLARPIEGSPHPMTLSPSLFFHQESLPEITVFILTYPIPRYPSPHACFREQRPSLSSSFSIPRLNTLGGEYSRASASVMC